MLDYKRKQLSNVIGGLNCASKTRLHQYCKHLREFRNPMRFDDRMRDVLREISCDVDYLNSQLEYLRSIGFNQSRYEYGKLLEQLERFNGENHAYFGWNRYFKSAKSKLISEVARWNCRPIPYFSQESIVEAIPRLDTHAGFSYILTGKRLKGDHVDGMFDEWKRQFTKAKKEGSFMKPILLGSRTQGSGAFDHNGERTGTFKSKTRLVSMIDIYQIMGERKFQRDFQEGMASARWYAGGKSDREIHSILNYNSSHYRNWISIDYSHYDQSISDWLIYEAFDVIRSSFVTMSSDDQRLFDIIKEDFIHKAFVDGQGNLVFSDKGVPSGSMFTQIIDSICNRLMIDTYLLSKGYDLDRRDMMIMGDDNIIFTDKKIDLNDLVSYLYHNFGIEANASKCSFGDYTQAPEFLSRIWDDKITRGLGDLIAKLCYPERFREYDKWDQHPITIVINYMESFPGGMQFLVDSNKFRDMVRRERRSSSTEYHIMSGLAKYRARYCSG